MLNNYTQKNKVGILTFHSTDNPGSLLQAYALKTAVEKQGFICDVINYQKRGWKEKSYIGYRQYFNKKFGFFGKVLFRLFIPILNRRIRKFDVFRYKYIKLDKKIIDTMQGMKKLNLEYSCFITGSDQVWNRNNAKVDDTHFLNFVDDSNLKIAYAPSFGVSELSESERVQNKTLLKRFNAISVREIQGVELVREIIGYDAPLVLDPTLLLSEADWVPVIKKYCKKDYILLYLRKISPSVAQFAENLSRTTGLKIVQVAGVRRRSKNGETVRTPTPNEWLGLIQNAAYVVTNSFHGIAFSLNFNKQFFVEPISGSQSETNSRIYSILKQFNLENRIIDKEKMFVQPPQNIDYTIINKIMDEKRKSSMGYLKNALNGGTDYADFIQSIK